MEKIMNAKCRSKTKAGKPCKATPVAAGLCAFHSDPSRAAQLGRIGGKRNRHLSPDDEIEQIPAPRTAEDVKTLLAETMVRVRARRVEPKVASVMAYLGTAFLNALESAELERRVAELEIRISKTSGQ